MRLSELFDEDPDGVNDDADIRNYLMDVLLPLYDGGVPFVSVQSVQDQLENLDTGINLDDDYVMNLLNPDKFKIIKKIEDDKIYFNQQFDPDTVVSDTEKEKGQKRFDKLAADQAAKEVKK
jgi:hypothetical protein